MKDVKINALSIVAVMIFSVFVYWFFSMPVLAFIDNNISGNMLLIRNNLIISRLVVTLGLIALFMINPNQKRDFIVEILKWLVILVISTVFSKLIFQHFLSSNYWWLICLHGIFVGVVSYLLHRQTERKNIGLISGVIAILSILQISYDEYFFTMEPPDFPSVIYIESFQNWLMWLAAVLFIVLPAYFLSRGFFIKVIFK